MLNKSMQFWKDRAQEIDALIKVRYMTIERMALIEQVEYYREKAEIMEEWKDKVEFQRQGLEKQVGELEAQRCALEAQRCALEAQRCALESELEKARSIEVYPTIPWRVRVKEKLFPKGSLRRRILAKIKRIFSFRKNKQ